MKISFILLFSLCAITSSVFAANIFVSPAGGGDGSSWASPKSFFTLTQAEFSSNNIYMLEGNYTMPSQLSHWRTIGSGTLNIFGGFEAATHTSGTTTTDADPINYRSIIHINITSGALFRYTSTSGTSTINGVEFTDGSTNSGSCAFSIIPSDGTVVFNFEKCTFTGNSGRDNAGAVSILAQSASNLTANFKNCYFASNSVTVGSTFSGGGAVSIAKAGVSTATVNSSIDNCTFTGNIVSAVNETFGGGGGAIFYSAQNTGTHTITNSFFCGNYITNGGVGNNNTGGGAVYLNNTNLSISNTTFNGNYVHSSSNQDGNFGATAVFSVSNTNSLTINNSTSYGNYTSPSNANVMDIAATAASGNSISNSAIQFASNSTNYPNFTLTNNTTSSSASQCPSRESALPVVFGSISASVKSNNTLTVLFSTLEEINNSHFVIEGSADGVNFTEIGTVSTAAKDGNSDTTLNYTFIHTIQSAASYASLAVVGIFGLLLLAFSKKRRRIALPLLAGMLLCTALFVSCSKGGDAEIKGGNLFIRIAQVDKDGGKTYSKVVKASQL